MKGESRSSRAYQGYSSETSGQDIFPTTVCMCVCVFVLTWGGVHSQEHVAQIIKRQQIPINTCYKHGTWVKKEEDGCCMDQERTNLALGWIFISDFPGYNSWILIKINLGIFRELICMSVSNYGRAWLLGLGDGMHSIKCLHVRLHQCHHKNQRFKIHKKRWTRCWQWVSGTGMSI